MKNKFLFLSTLVSSCLATILCNQLSAEQNPGMPTGSRPKCYPASKCTGDPNLMGGERQCAGDQQQHGQDQQQGANAGQSYMSRRFGYNSNAPGAAEGKTLQTESTEKFNGVVKSVNRVQLPNEAQIQIVLSTEQGDQLVIVGPASFVDQSKIKLQAGDKVVVTGYRITANGKDVVVAAQIQRNGNTLKLLNDNRMPQWGSAPGMQGGGMSHSGSQNGSGYTRNW